MDERKRTTTRKNIVRLKRKILILRIEELILVLIIALMTIIGCVRSNTTGTANDLEENFQAPVETIETIDRPENNSDQNDYEMAYTWVMAHAEELPANLVTMAEDNMELSRFLYLWKTGNYTMPEEILLTEQEKEANIPLFLQWDDRWGFYPYCDGVMGTSGCGPSCMATVANGLLKDDTINPKIVAEFASDHGFVMSGTGTKWALFEAFSEDKGLTCKNLGTDIEAVLSELRKGHPVICSMTKGTFTYGGHFIVLVAIDDKGIMINDPMSIEKSNSRWEISTFESEIKNAWSFY
ncbi:MAG: C39 family peptidase [Lachnospiraceae bacterium]|nr:C39 family peptidase [Lachnospiraceae bacterium]